jgi:HSP20 family protein
VTHVAEDPHDDDRRDPFEEWRKRLEDDPFLGPFFEDLDREFARMQESLSRMLERMEAGDLDPEADPFVYGFSVQMGPDGQPDFSEFGNVDAQREPGSSQFDEARKPLVDVQEDHAHVAVTAELPGVATDDINLRAKEEEIVISVDDPDNRFFKRVAMPTAIEPRTTDATYKNGVLDVEVEKADEDEGTPIDVE